MKFGGTSVGSIERIQNVAARCVKVAKEGHEVAVVVSAMAGETNRLLGLVNQISDSPAPRESDVVVSTGEQVTIGLLSMAIHALGYGARSFLGHQIRMQTDSAFSRARILSIEDHDLTACLASGKIAVIAGFQGINDKGEVTTLGRGGSDTTAVAIAAAIKADSCEIFTDVDGVFTTDPNIVPAARKIERITYEEMLEMASLGAKVLQIRSVELAMKYGVRLHVRSSFHEGNGTFVVPEANMESILVSGVTLQKDEAKITLRRVPDVVGVAAQVFKPLSEQGISVDMIVQNIAKDGKTDLTFTVGRQDVKQAVALLKSEVSEFIEQGAILSDESVAKVSIVGVGMRSHSGVAQQMFQILSEEDINIQLISTSEIKVSCLVDDKYGELAVRVLHEGFGLDKSRARE